MRQKSNERYLIKGGEKDKNRMQNTRELIAL